MLYVVNNTIFQASKGMNPGDGNQKRSTKMSTENILLKISERGNGLTSKGANVYDAYTDTVYELTGNYPGGVIFTGSPGEGNFCYMYGKEVGAASDLSEEEFSEIAAVAIEVCAKVGAAK